MRLAAGALSPAPSSGAPPSTGREQWVPAGALEGGGSGARPPSHKLDLVAGVENNP